MAEHNDALALIQAKLQQAILKNQSREYVRSLSLNGRRELAISRQ